MNGPQWPEAQPWENYFFAAVVVIVVVLNRRSMLGRARWATSVLYPGEDPATMTDSTRRYG